MAERRMFARSIVLSDAFLDMPLSARCLYFTLGMLADDDGFIGSPKAIMRECGATQDDMLLLLQKRFVLSFDSGVIVIKHWKINNYLRADRYTKTNYIDELNQLMIDENKAYTEKAPEPGQAAGCQVVYQRYTQNSIDKSSVDKNSIGESENKKIKYAHISLSESELENLKVEMSDYCQGVPSWRFYLEYMEEQGAKRRKTYTAKDVLGWYEEDKANKKRIFTTAPASYDINEWKNQNMKGVPKYEKLK